MAGWGSSGLPQKCHAHSSLKSLKVIPSIKACIELGLWSHVLHLSVRASYGCEMFCSYIFRVLKQYFCCVAF